MKICVKSPTKKNFIFFFFFFSSSFYTQMLSVWRPPHQKSNKIDKHSLIHVQKNNNIMNQILISFYFTLHYVFGVFWVYKKTWRRQNFRVISYTHRKKLFTFSLVLSLSLVLRVVFYIRFTLYRHSIDILNFLDFCQHKNFLIIIIVVIKITNVSRTKLFNMHPVRVYMCVCVCQI